MGILRSTSDCLLLMMPPMTAVAPSSIIRVVLASCVRMIGWALAVASPESSLTTGLSSRVTLLSALMWGVTSRLTPTSYIWM